MSDWTLNGWSPETEYQDKLKWESWKRKTTMTKKRFYTRGDNTYVVRKSMSLGVPEYSRGYRVKAWYVKHISESDAQHSWTKIGRTLDDVRAWARREEMRPMGTK